MNDRSRLKETQSMHAFVLSNKVDVLASKFDLRRDTDKFYVIVCTLSSTYTTAAATTSYDHRIDVPGPQQSCHLLNHFIPRVSI